MGYFKVKYGPWTLVTGGTSGIGREFANQLAEKGLNIVLIARDKNKLQKTAKEISDKYKIDTKIISVDLSDSNFLNVIKKDADNINIGLLINNAGITLAGAFIKDDLQEQESLIKINVIAPIKSAHYFANRMAAKNSGGIIFTSSTAGHQPFPCHANYSGSKAYIYYWCCITHGIKR